MKVVLAIDPGEVHVGVAWFSDHDYYAEEHSAAEIRPAELIRTLEQEVLDTVICEEFRLYPWKMKEQGFSQFKTIELIGVIKHICTKRHIDLIEQPANIKKPTDGILTTLSKNAVFPSHRHGGHARDAELHGWYYFRNYLRGDAWANCKW